MSGSADFICALCAKGASKKGKEKKPVYLRSLLFHLTRKQKRQLAQGFPSFDEKYEGCHPSCYYRFGTWATHHQFFTPFVTCSICSEDISDSDKAMIPPCHIIAHSIHQKCLTCVPNGCPMCRKGHSVYRDRLRHTRKKLFIESGWSPF